MSERTLLKKVNELKALEARKKAIEKQITDIREDTKKELQTRGREENFLIRKRGFRLKVKKMLKI